MWDKVLYETKKEAMEKVQEYQQNGFETETLEEEGKHLIYTRRVVTEIVLDDNK